MSDHSDVTVVITNYNYGAYLREAVSSVFAQVGGAPVIVVVDDGSTEPGTDDLLASLPAEVDVLRQSNGGVASARNAGLALARTEFLMLLDADDRLRPTALSSLRGTLKAEPDLGFAYGITTFFGDQLGELQLPAYDPYKLLYRNMVGLTCLFRRALLDGVGGFDGTFRGYEDWEFWLHALSEGWQGRRIDVPTLDYRRHGVSLNVNHRREYRRWFRLIQQRHRALYERRGELARQSRLGWVVRAVYRWWWGPRPLPAWLELRLQALYWSLTERRRVEAER